MCVCVCVCVCVERERQTVKYLFLKFVYIAYLSVLNEVTINNNNYHLLSKKHLKSNEAFNTLYHIVKEWT